jgi:hypothetical protein
VTIVATSIMVHKSLEAAETLAAEGIEVEVIDLRTLRPMDTATIIESVKKTTRLACVYEGVKTLGIGAEISARIAESEAFDYLDAPILRLGGAESPIPYNPVLEKAAVPQVQGIIDGLRNLVTGRTESMAVEVILPKVDMDMATGKISKWHVGEGERVAKGAVLFEIETDKAAMEIEAPADGILRNIVLVAEGSRHPSAVPLPISMPRVKRSSAPAAKSPRAEAEAPAPVKAAAVVSAIRSQEWRRPARHAARPQACARKQAISLISRSAAAARAGASWRRMFARRREARSAFQRPLLRPLPTDDAIHKLYQPGSFEAIPSMACAAPSRSA